MSAPLVLRIQDLPVQPKGATSPEWWGVVALVVIEATVFTALIASYFHFRTQNPAWPPPFIEPPELPLASANTLLLVLSALPMLLAVRRLRSGAQAWRWALPLAMVMISVFLGLKLYEYGGKHWGPMTHAYGSVVFTMTGLHIAHVTAVLLKTAVIYVYLLTGRVDARRPAPLEANAVYWYFVVAIWLPLYSVIYLSPRVF